MTEDECSDVVFIKAHGNHFEVGAALGRASRAAVDQVIQHTEIWRFLSSIFPAESNEPRHSHTPSGNLRDSIGRKGEKDSQHTFSRTVPTEINELERSHTSKNNLSENHGKIGRLRMRGSGSQPTFSSSAAGTRFPLTMAETVRANFLAMLHASSRVVPHVVEEVRGLAEGADLPFELVFAWQIRYELLRGCGETMRLWHPPEPPELPLEPPSEQSLESLESLEPAREGGCEEMLDLQPPLLLQPPPPESQPPEATEPGLEGGCSTLMLPAEASASLAHNEDGAPELRSFCFLADVKVTESLPRGKSSQRGGRTHTYTGHISHDPHLREEGGDDGHGQRNRDVETHQGHTNSSQRTADGDLEKLGLRQNPRGEHVSHTISRRFKPGLHAEGHLIGEEQTSLDQAHSPELTAIPNHFFTFVYPLCIPGHSFAVNHAGLAQTINNVRVVFAEEAQRHQTQSGGHAESSHSLTTEMSTKHIATNSQFPCLPRTFWCRAVLDFTDINLAEQFLSQGAEFWSEKESSVYDTDKTDPSSKIFQTKVTASSRLSFSCFHHTLAQKGQIHSVEGGLTRCDSLRVRRAMGHANHLVRIEYGKAAERADAAASEPGPRIAQVVTANSRARQKRLDNVLNATRLCSALKQTSATHRGHRPLIKSEENEEATGTNVRQKAGLCKESLVRVLLEDPLLHRRSLTDADGENTIATAVFDTTVDSDKTYWRILWYLPKNKVLQVYLRNCEVLSKEVIDKQDL